MKITKKEINNKTIVTRTGFNTFSYYVNINGQKFEANSQEGRLYVHTDTMRGYDYCVIDNKKDFVNEVYASIN